MAAQLFYLPFRPAIDMNGFPIAGAKAYFYLTGTNTLAPIYTTDALSVLLPNPVTADAAGRWPSIYLDDTVTYRLVIKDASDVTIPGFDVDPYIASIADDITDEMQQLYEDTVAARDAALAAFGGLVFDGFYAYDAVTGTRKAWDGLRWAIAPHVYIDPINGDDSYDGTAGTWEGGTVGPVKTRTGAEACDAMIANAADDTPVTIALKSSDDWWRDGFDYFTASSRNGNSTRNYVSFVPYDGTVMKVSCCDVVDKGDITAHGTIANAYTVTVPHEMMDSSGTNYTSVFVDGERLKHVDTEAECSVAGTWYAASNGQATPSTDLVITFHLLGSVAPAAVGDIEVTTRTTAFAGYNNCYVEGLWAFGNGCNNGSIVLNNNGRMVRCLAEEGTKHSAYIGGNSIATDTIALNCGRSDDDRASSSGYGGGMFVAYGSGTGFTNGMDATFTRCGAIIDNSYMTDSDGGAGGSRPWYSHASGYLGTLIHYDCWDSGCNSGSGTEAGAVILSGYTSYSDFVGNSNVYGVASPTSTITVEDGFFFGSCNLSMWSAADLILRRNVMVGNYSWLFFYGSNCEMSDNIIVSESSSQRVVQLIPTAIENLTINNNLFVGMYIPYTLDYASSAAIDHNNLIIDRNLYVVAPDGNMIYYFAAIEGASKTFAQWQALGEDVNGALIQTSDTAAIDALFLSGTRPTTVTLDARIDPDGAAADYVRTTFSETAWQRAINLPRTRAAAVAYIENEAAASVVFGTVSDPDPATIDLDSLPTSDPGIDGQLWNDGGALAVSGSTGTVTSVAMTVPTGFSVSGSPITESGTLAVTYSAGYQGYTSTEAAKVALLSGTNTGDQDLSGYATTAAVAAGYQPLDSDLTAIAALTTTSYGRGLLALADAAALRSSINVADGATANTGTVTSVAGTGTKNGLTLTGTVTTSGSLTLGGTLAINNADWSGTALAVTNGGTGTGTAFTAGSIVFAGSGGVYAQDNSKLFWDDTKNRLGVGTAAPQYIVELYDATNATFGITSDAAAALQVQRSQNAANGGNFNFRKTRGTAASPAAVASGDQIGNIRFLAYGGTNYRAIAAVEGTVDTYTSNSDISSYLSLYTTPAGSITAVERFRIGPVGQLGIGGATYGNAGDVLVSGGSGAAPSWGTLSNSTVDGTNPVGFRNVPQSGSAKTGSYSLATTDVGKFIEVGSGGSITVPNSTFAAGDIVSIFNNTSGNVTLTMSITTAYIGGTDSDKATITLATRGVATVLFISGTVCVVSGNVS